MSDRSDPALERYASFLADCIRRVFGITLPPNFESQFFFHAKRLGSVDYEDLGSLVLLECQEKLAAGKSMDAQEIQRTVDRLRHRLARKARRELPLEMAEDLPAKASVSPERAKAIVREFIDRLSPIEAVVFELRCLQGQHPQSIASHTGLSPATIYRIQNSVRGKFEAFVRNG